MPKTSTGPETTNIFAPRPVTKPSLLNSSAGETIEFAKPVIGTSVPAPACYVVIHAEGGQRRGEKNQRDGNKGARVPQREAEQHEEVCDALPERADCAAE